MGIRGVVVRFRDRLIDGRLARSSAADLSRLLDYAQQDVYLLIGPDAGRYLEELRFLRSLTRALSRGVRVVLVISGPVAAKLQRMATEDLQILTTHGLVHRSYGVADRKYVWAERFPKVDGDVSPIPTGYFSLYRDPVTATELYCDLTEGLANGDSGGNDE